MTNEEAAKRILSMIERGENNVHDVLFDVLTTLEINALKYAYSALSRDRWISVEERLPEFDKKVLAWVENKDPEGSFNGKHGIYVAQLKDKEPKPDPEGKRNFWGIPGYDSVWTVWSWSYFTEPDVQYWMPLPEPPKEAHNGE